MSNIKNLKIAVEDDRGIILDVFKSSPKDHCALITFKKDSQRANHYHKRSIQYTFVVSGDLLLRTAKVDEDGKFISEIGTVFFLKDLILLLVFIAFITSIYYP